MTTVVRDELRKELAKHPMGKSVVASGGRKLRALKMDELREALAAAELALKKKEVKEAVEVLGVVEETRARVAAGDVSKCAEHNKNMTPIQREELAKIEELLKPEEKEELPMAAEVLTMNTAKPRQLTSSERSGVRKLLDQYFMDDEGRYMNNYSDQRIGEELNIPWSLVTAMRETAYGPLKADPKIDQVRRELLDLKERLVKAEKVVGDVVADVRQRIASAEATLAKIDLS